MVGIRRLWKILKITKVDKIFIGFVLFVMLISILFWMVEPSILSYGDALWYAFSVVTTIGFGDYTAVTLVGRLGSMIIGFYGIFMVALIPGVVVSYYMEFLQVKADETTAEFLEKLENLEHLSKKELADISNSVKKRKYKI